MSRSRTQEPAAQGCMPAEDRRGLRRSGKSRRHRRCDIRARRMLGVRRARARRACRHNLANAG
jgi:hypothetical protein